PGPLRRRRSARQRAARWQNGRHVPHQGRKVVVPACDFTVRSGSASGQNGGLGAELTATERALEWRLPLVRLLDVAGGSVRKFESLGRTYLPDANSFTYVDVKLLNTAPVVSAVLGAAAGIGALH